MNRVALACTTIAGLCLLAAAAMITAGPLDPPAGPVASTYKTLAEVEPRIAINATNTPGDSASIFIIRSPGSYYLTGDLLIPEPYARAIWVNSGDVTIDLNGFRIDGLERTVAGVATLTSAAPRIVVRNGRINSCAGGGVNLQVGDGCLVEDVWVEACAQAGIWLRNRGRVLRCSSDRNAGPGIRVGADSVVSECTANTNSGGIVAGSGASIDRCTANSNTGTGVSVGANSIVSGCVANSNRVGIVGATGVSVERCTANGNPDGGITLTTGVVRQCTASGTTAGAGIGVGTDSTVSECFANLNGTGITSGERSTVERCTINRNSGLGVQVGHGGVVRHCAIRNNAGMGINAGDHALIELSSVVGGGGGQGGVVTGSRARVVECSVSATTGVGIIVGANSVVERCSAVGNSFGISGSDGVSVLACTCSDNSERGISLNNGGTVANCTTRNNQQEGILVNFSCVVRDNNCNGDGVAAGLHGAIHVIGESNRIEGNHITYADVAMYIQAGGNTVVRNSLRGNTATVNAVGGNDLAPFTPASGASNPWANILN